VNLPNGLVKQFTAGAVSITHNGASGALMAMVHVWDKDKGFLPPLISLIRHEAKPRNYKAQACGSAPLTTARSSLSLLCATVATAR
jgi:hypothetical protein